MIDASAHGKSFIFNQTCSLAFQDVFSSEFIGVTSTLKWKTISSDEKRENVKTRKNLNMDHVHHMINCYF